MFELVEKKQHSRGQPQRTLVSVLVAGVPDASRDRLSDTGMNQISELCRSRIVSGVDRVVCGPGQVVVASAEIASNEFGVRYEVEKSLADPRIDRERDVKKYADRLTRWWSEPDLAPTGGETLNEARHRVTANMNSLASKNLGATIAIIVSPAVDVIVRALVLGGDPSLHDWLECGYASCTAYEYVGGSWSLVMPAENSYLSEPLSVADSLPVELRRALEGP